MNAPRYVYCRPSGGLVDTLNQIERCRAYAQAHGRILVVDSARSGIAAPFHEVFRPRPSFGVEVLAWTPQTRAMLNDLPSVFPAFAAGQLDALHTEMKIDGVAMTAQLRSAIARDRDASVVVHVAYGGGPRALSLLSRVRLVPELADGIMARLAGLVPGYDAIHVRNTDYKTDVPRLIARLRPVVRGRRVLLAGDNVASLDEITAGLSGVAEAFRVSAIRDTGGQPMHFGTERAETFALDLWTDLFALAGADRIYFSAVHALGASGYSVLAETLRRRPECIDRLLGRETAPAPPASGWRGLRVELATARFWLGNGAAARHANRYQIDGEALCGTRPGLPLPG